MNSSDLNDDQRKSVEEIPRIEFYLSKLGEMTQLMEEEDAAKTKELTQLQDQLFKSQNAVKMLKTQVSDSTATHEESLADVHLIKDTLYKVLQLYNMPLSESDLSTCQELERTVKLNPDFSISHEQLQAIKDSQSLLHRVYNRYFKDAQIPHQSPDFVGSTWNISEGQSIFTKTQLPLELKDTKLLIHFSGPHGTDIIHSCFNALDLLSTKYEFAVHDVNIHRAWHDVQVMLSLSVVYLKSQSILDIFDEMASQWHGQYHIQLLEDTTNYQFETAPYPSRNKFMITLLNNQMPSNSNCAQISQFLKICLDLKISVEVMRSLNKQHTAWDIRVSSMNPFLIIRKSLFSAMKSNLLDVAVTPLSVYRKQRRLIVFDMDSTLIQQEVIDELARAHGCFDKVKEITHLAMQGKLDFKQSLEQRVALLNGAPISIIDDVKHDLVLTPGAIELCTLLKRLGFQICVLSGGFEPFIKHIQTMLPIDHYFANNFKIKLNENGEQVIDGLKGEIVDAQRKADLLRILAQAHHLELQQVIAIGDGSNDIPMLKTAGLGIAFKAKPIVQEQIESKLSGSLLDVMYLMGYAEEEINELLALEGITRVSGVVDAVHPKALPRPIKKKSLKPVKRSAPKTGRRFGAKTEEQQD